ncbi:MAG: DUF116 domain-containing protein [Candidatus Aenigmatarchaeota archaeon]
MSYSFDFDLTKVSRSFFREIACLTERSELHRKAGDVSRKLVEKTSLDKLTGIPMSDAITLMEDMVDIHAKNLAREESFRETERRALFLPHCGRKHMDDQCEASFNPELSSYTCEKCSEDCLIRKATEIGEDRGYDVYIFPGGSCIPKVLSKKNYGGVVGVACAEEVKLGIKKLEEAGVDYQGIPLLKNGCAHTEFNLKTLKEKL